ncbi:MAG: penicillin-binding protein 1B, partial [Candidatus Contendobacter sp.]
RQHLAGSLIKPVTYLTALEQPDRYTLMTLLNDSPLVYTSGGRRWAPSNYDKRYHGRVTLRDALARSYNIPAVRVGLDVDVIKVVEMLHRLGFERELKPYPALLLGALEASPFEIAQVYATIANGGFRIPLRAIREVTNSGGQSLQLYAMDVVKAVEPGPAYLITNAMQQVVKAGTASAMKSKLSPDLNIAGKTGTTDDYRDSWFAGFSGDRLTVVWLGRDDNKPTGLSGASGALRVWMDLMAGLKLEPLDAPPPADVEEIRVEPRSGLRVGQGCGRGEPVPFLVGSEPRGSTSCAPPAPRRPKPRPPATDDADDAGGMSDFFQRLME